MVPLMVAAFLLSAVLSADAIPFLIRLARKRGFVDRPGPRKVHTEPIPYGGGLAVALGTLATLGAGIAAAILHVRVGWFEDLPASLHAEGVLFRLPTLLVYGAGSLLILLLGLSDDRTPKRASYKLLIQTMIAIGTVLGGGERLSLFWEGRLAGDLLGAAVTVLWIVGITNAFNLLDHMDGVAAGTAFLVAASFGVVALQTGQVFLAVALAAIGGGSIGFLLFNLPPARIFLGDAGSLFLGYWLAVLTVSFTFYESGRPLYSYAVPLVVLAVPLYDTGRVVLSRLRRGVSPFQGDTNHIAHRLVSLGMSPRGAVLAVYALTLITGLAAVLLYQVDRWGALVLLGQILLVFLLLTIVEIAGRKGAGYN